MIPKSEPIEADDLFYWTAFNELSCERALNEIPGPIPWSAKRKYAEDLGLSELETDDFMGILKIMDDIFVGHYADQHKQRMDAAKANRKR